MTKLLPSDFTDHADWIAYLRHFVLEDEQAYTFANGRTELFVRLYQAPTLSFLSGFEQETSAERDLTEAGDGHRLGLFEQTDIW